MKNNELNNSNKTKLFVLTLLVLLVSVAGISYAYFTIQITGNDTASSMRLRTANMSLVYNDVQIVSGEYITPGWSDTKTLTVTNNGNVTVDYTIKFRELVNTIVNGELVLSATCSASTGTCDNLPQRAVHSTSTEITDAYMYGPITIAPGVTHTYTVTVLFKETGSNQNYNQNKEFYGTLNIAEYEPPFKPMGLDSATGLPVVRLGTEEFYDITSTVNHIPGKTVLLAKYNLYVGQTCTSSSSCTPISILASGYGLQSADAKGYVSTWPAIGVVPFSGSNNSYGYWDPNGSGMISKYGVYSGAANNIYDIDYVAAPNYSAAFQSDLGNANYSIAYYVEQYVNRLGIDAEGRLLTYAEANTLTQTQRTNGARYWLGSATTNNYARIVNATGTFSVQYFYNTVYYGVRPVIVINTSAIESTPVKIGNDSSTGLPKVAIGNEEFFDISNVIRYSSFDSEFLSLINYDQNKSILLAKNVLSKTVLSQTESTNASDFGVPFAGSSSEYGYWYDTTTSTLKPQYGTSYTTSNVYDVTRNAAPNYSVAFSSNAGNANYSIAYYVEAYISKLGINGTGRLLTYNEAYEMQTNSVRKTSAGQNYWLGTASFENMLNHVISNGSMGSATFSSTDYDGIRPIIIIDTSDIRES